MRCLLIHEASNAKWRRVGIACLAALVTACGSAPKATKNLTSSNEAKPARSALAWASTSASAATPASGGEPLEKERELLDEQKHQADADSEAKLRAELQRKLEEKKAEETKTPHESHEGEAPDKCNCAPGDPLCSCVDNAPPPKRRASVRAASTASMSGRISREVVESAVASHIELFASCSDADATVSLKALIADSGRVTDASARWSAPDVAGLRDCVVAAFKTIQFPSSTDGKSAPIEFDLTLSRPS